MPPREATLIQCYRAVGQDMGEGLNVATETTSIIDAFPPSFKIIVGREGVYSSDKGKL